MSKSFVLLFCLLAGLLLFGCSKPETTTNREAAAPATANTNKPAASPAATAATSSAEKVGVPECDAYISAYETCVNSKVPAAARAQFNTQLAQLRKTWHDLAEKPSTKATLAGACKSQLETAKQTMKTYGCTF